MVLELGIIVSHVTWRLTHRKLLEEAKAAGLTVDEFLEGRETHTHENKAMAEAPKNLEGKNQPV